MFDLVRGYLFWTLRGSFVCPREKFVYSEPWEVRTFDLVRGSFILNLERFMCLISWEVRLIWTLRGSYVWPRERFVFCYGNERFIKLPRGSLNTQVSSYFETSLHFLSFLEYPFPSRVWAFQPSRVCGE